MSPATSARREAAWSSTQQNGCSFAFPRLSKECSPQLKQARILLKRLPHIDEKRVNKAVETIHNSSQIERPRATSWIFHSVRRMLPAGQDRNNLLEQADLAMKECVIMRKIQTEWKKYWNDPFDAVSGERRKYCQGITAQTAFSTYEARARLRDRGLPLSPLYELQILTGEQAERPGNQANGKRRKGKILLGRKAGKLQQRSRLKKFGAKNSSET